MLTQLRQRFDNYQPGKAQAFWFAIAGVLATLVIGFAGAGWVTGGTATAMAQEAAVQARTQLAVSMCVEEFMAAGDVKARLEKLKGASWYERDEMLAASGYATMPDEKAATNAVAMQCAMQLAELAPEKAAATPAAGKL